MARVVAESGAGEVVPEGAPAAVAAAVAALLDNPQRRESAADAGRRWAADRRWSLVAKPLLEFADNPWRDGHRERFSELAPGQVAGDEPLLQKLQRALRRKRGSR